MYFRENDQPIENYETSDAGDMGDIPNVPYIKKNGSLDEQSFSAKPWLLFLIIVAFLSVSCYLVFKVMNRQKAIKTYYAY